MYKVIYFDEGSATDFLQIHFGGNIEVVDEENGKFNYNLKSSASGTVGIGKNFLSLIKASFTLSGSANLEKSKDTLLKSTLTNTLLSDFVEFAKSDENKGYIQTFNNFKVDAIKNSLAYVKMYSPYIKFLKEGTEFTEELADFNYMETDEILKGAKGYYELLAEKDEDNEKSIFRFNINSFRNSYTLTDLTKMNLTYYGIKVGECNLEDLQIENEFPKDDESVKLTAAEIHGQVAENEDEAYLAIYDILLVGVTGDTN